MPLTSPSTTRLALTLSLSLFVCGMRPAHADPAWSMKDAQSLATAQSYGELLAGADKVPPSARSKEWSSLVSQAARGRLQALTSEAQSGSQAQDILDLVTTAEAKYTFLGKDAAYTKAKSAALEPVLGFCLKSRAYGCSGALEVLARGVATLPKGAASSIALLMSDDQRMPSETFRFWAMAAADDAANCKYGALQSATLGALASDKSDLGAQGVKVAKICYATMEDSLVRQIESVEKSAAYPKNVCPLLKAHGKSTMATRDKCP